MTVVTFNEDVFPHVRGEVVDLDADEKQRVDAVVKARKINNAYSTGSHPVDSVDDSRGARVLQANGERAAAKENAVDQAAQLKAQHSAVGEPANVDALGVVPEHPAQVVTGTAPVADVEVTNPQEATVTGNPEGANVKGAKGNAGK